MLLPMALKHFFCLNGKLQFGFTVRAKLDRNTHPHIRKCGECKVEFKTADVSTLHADFNYICDRSDY